MSPSRDALGTAYHEAGHFVASYILKPTYCRGSVTIVPDATRGTLGMSTDEDGVTCTEGAEAEVLVLLAGYASERTVDPAAPLASSASDTEDAVRILALLGAVNDLEGWRARAARFVADHRAEIAAVAGELLTYGTLDADEAETVVDVARGEATHADLEAVRAWKPRGGVAPPAYLQPHHKGEHREP